MPNVFLHAFPARRTTPTPTATDIPFSIAEELAAHLANNVFVNPGDPMPEAMRVPVLDRKSITGLSVIVSPAGREPIRRNRSAVDHFILVDVAVIKPCGSTNIATIENEVAELADTLIESILGLELDETSSRVVTVEQPAVFDPEYKREHNLAVSIIRARIKK